jgi:hypothetical protein
MTIRIHSTPEKVFAYMDQSVNIGMHMTESSTMMMGSKLKLIQLSENATGLHSKFKWAGDILGLPIDFTVEVIWWIKDKEKVWETVGNAKMIIMKWYQMHLFLSPEGKDTNVSLTIVYQLPDPFIHKVISFFLAPLYANWCLKNMLLHSKIYLESTT